MMFSPIYLLVLDLNMITFYTIIPIPILISYTYTFLYHFVKMAEGKWKCLPVYDVINIQVISVQKVNDTGGQWYRWSMIQVVNDTGG